MASGGPNIQLELRLAEMARMNEEIKRRHMEVEADKQRAKRSGNMVSSAQSITMQTQMPADYDGSREDGFKDGLDSRPLPADPYGKDRVPRDKRGKPGDMKLKKKGRDKGVYGNMPQQSIDEARQRVRALERDYIHILFRESAIPNSGVPSKQNATWLVSNEPEDEMEPGYVLR